MKLTALLLFAFVATVAAHRQQVSSSWEKDYLKTAQPFMSGNVYRFRYDSQISSGLGSMDTVNAGEQKSTHRFSAMVNVNFETARSATLRLEDIRIASLNGELPELRRVQSLQLFDEETIESRKLEELQMSCTFEYSEGAIERVYFNEKDTVWSKNIKRAILNLVQLNLKERDNQQDEERNVQIEDSSDVSLSNKMFAVNETTVEGECEVIYSITKVSNNDEDRKVFNVTKAINFKKCSKIPTMHYGRRIEKPSLLSKRRELEEQQLDRSTVLRYQLVGTLDKYAIANVELLSQYTVDAEEIHAMQTVVASRLIIESVEKQSERVERSRNAKEESLLYSSEWDLIEKRFYQYGDEEYTSQTTPFRHVQNKVKMIVSMIKKIAESTNDKTNGIETETTLKLQKAVDFLRMCETKEIEEIASELKRQEHELDIFMDVCAMAGTRNTIHYLVQKITNGEISSTKAVFLLRQLSSLPAISDKQVDIVLHLCKHESVERSASLRQACWLTAGSMIGDLCKETVRDHKMCPRQKKEKYVNTLWIQFTSAENQYEKILALKAIGNAANDLAVINLENIIRDRSQSPMIRIHAIDALRRLRNEMPRKIQRILLPIFKNTIEVPEVRMTAFSMLMATFPEKVILDQITYTLHSERSNHVKSFVLRVYNALSTSVIPEEREMAPHLRTALTLANVDLDMSCQYHRIPLYSGESQEGVFLNLASIFSTTDGIPKHLSASLDSLFNGLFEKDTVSISLSQQNLEDLYHRFMQNWYQMDDRRSIRAERSSRNGEQELDTIFDDFKIKAREAFERTPFGLINLRIHDIDQVILPLGEEHMPRIVKAIFNGEKLSTKDLHSALLSGTPMRFTTALSFQERSVKIATSAGMPLHILHSLPVIASFNGNVKVQISSENVKIIVKGQPLLSGVQTRKMEIWCPVVNTGVESLRSIELNLPIDMETSVLHKNAEEKVKLLLRVPEQKTRLVGLHTLPLTFIRKYDAKLGHHGKTHVKTIRSTMMDSRHKEIHPTQNSFTVSGHYYHPREFTVSALNGLAWSSESHVQVNFERQSECADAIELLITSRLFQSTEISSAKPQFDQFYQDAKKFQPVFDDDVEADNDDETETETHNDRRSRLTTYLSDEYKPRAAYRHFVNAVVKTIGGSVNHKASVKLEATCDSHMAFCRIVSDIRRTPMLRGEKSEWSLKAESQILMPEYVREVSELNDKKSQNKLAATLNAEWGCKEMQKVNLQLHGERSVPQQWIQRSGEQWRRVLATAFVNKYDLVAEYKLSPSMKTRLQHYYELLKYWNYWNADSSDSMEGRENEVKVTLILNPQTRQHFNVYIKTPSERTRLTNIRLPMTIKPLPLIRPQEHQRYEIDSVEDAINEYSDARRAECRVDGRKIKTFDSVTYKAPIGRCYSIIAKDCARKSFVVLMKTLDEETDAKNIKIVTAKRTIEVELIRQKLVVKVNGEKVTDEDRLREYNIDYSEDLVRVMLPEGVSVRFNGKQATVKLSNYYKNAQCGLCGEFNGEQSDEFRMNDNSLTDDVKDFHRSYSMTNDDECKNIYNKDTLFGSASSSRQYSDDDFENEDMNEEVEEYDMFDRRDNSENRRRENVNDDEVQEPIMKTKVMEYNHKICFSLKPVKECPRGTTMEKAEDIKIPFTCKDRSSTEVRRLLREAKSKDITQQLEFNKPSFVETVRSARICV